MKKKTALSCFLLATTTTWGYAQEMVIDTIFIKERQLRESEKTQKVISLGKETFIANSTNLAEILRFNTPYHIKENGRGMSATPSFRGTTAQHTAFLWNGMAMNSLFLGQADVNNIGLLNFDRIDIKPGGGSNRYGSGVIGGSVHMQNTLLFNKGLQGDFYWEKGDFETYNSSLKVGYSNDKWSYKIHSSYSGSDNEYHVPEEKYINRNGQYRQMNAGMSVGTKLNKSNTLLAHLLLSEGKQNFPVYFEEDTKTKYETKGFKSMLNWEYKENNIVNDLRVAYAKEEFYYFEDINKQATNGAEADILFVKNTASYDKIKNWLFEVQGEFQHQKAKGYESGIHNPKRNTGSVMALVKNNLTEKVLFEASLRKDFIEDTESPILWAIGSRYDLSNLYAIKFNASTNFRIPTFNDMYWQPGGNPNLKPEKAIQLELGQEFKYKKFKLEVIPYYHYISEMIQWLPGITIWTPFNTSKVESYGVEAYGHITQPLFNGKLELLGSYSFTQSKDIEANQPLMYIPKHKATGTLRFTSHFFGVYLQALYSGRIYTTTDQKPESIIKAYKVFNAGIEVNPTNNLQVGVKAQNITNKVYQSMLYYPYPLRNYSLYFNIKF